MRNSRCFPIALFTRVLNFLHLQKEKVTSIIIYSNLKYLVEAFLFHVGMVTCKRNITSFKRDHSQKLIRTITCLCKRLTLKKRSRESWIERSGRVFFLRGRSMDKSLNCSRLVTTSPQLQSKMTV